MKKVTAAILAATFISTAFTPIAVAGQRSPWTKEILHDYYSVVRKLNKRAAGRDIIHYGINTKSGPRDPSKHEKAKFQRQLRKLLNPPRLMWTKAVPPSQPPAGTLSAFNIAGLPTCTWKPESGGNYTARNGIYWGKYQIGEDHWYPGRACYGLGKDPPGQEACAVRVEETEGLGAWVNC